MSEFAFTNYTLADPRLHQHDWLKQIWSQRKWNALFPQVWAVIMLVIMLCKLLWLCRWFINATLYNKPFCFIFVYEVWNQVFCYTQFGSKNNFLNLHTNEYCGATNANTCLVQTPTPPPQLPRRASNLAFIRLLVQSSQAASAGGWLDQRAPAEQPSPRSPAKEWRDCGAVSWITTLTEYALTFLMA